MLGAFLCLSLTYCNAQSITPSVINVTGSSAVSGYYRFDWSVGELCLIDTYTKPTLSVLNGLLFTGTEHAGNKNNANTFATDEVFIFPNPVADKTELNLMVQQAGTVIMMIMDAQGKLISTKQFDYNGVGQSEKVNLTFLPAGNYYLYLQLMVTGQSSAFKKGAFKLIHIRH
ncbi:MAG: T9SS type A sorting domain-containing protein [Chitinophagaceae bacterium]